MYILTGGAGFIGSCFLKLLNDKGIEDIIVVDNLGSSEKWKNLLGKKYINYVHKSKFFEKLASYKADTIKGIFHFGACSNTTERNADYLIENNYHFSWELAKYAKNNNIRFVYASSAATYGLGENGYSEDSTFLLRPLNPYGYSKLLFDQRVVNNNFDESFLGIRFFNVFGPNEYHKQDMASMVFKAFHQIKSTNKIRLFKSHNPNYQNGESVRDFIYVKDAIEAVWRLYEQDINGIYNLGTGKARSWNDLAKAVFIAMDKPVNIEYFDMPDALKEQYQYFTQADMSKFHKVVPNFSFTNLEDSISDYINNYLKQSNKYY